MSKYLKPTYEFLRFDNPTTLKEIAEAITALRDKDITFRVVSFSHANGGMTVLTVRNMLTDIGADDAVSELVATEGKASND